MEATREALARLAPASHHQLMTLEEYEQQALELEDRLAAMSDEEVIAEYQKTTGEPGDPWVDRLVNEMQERELDF